MIKIRIGFEKQLRQFYDTSEAFNWVRQTYSDIARNFDGPFIFSVLSYEMGNLESMDRFYFDGNRFQKEQINS